MLLRAFDAVRPSTRYAAASSSTESTTSGAIDATARIVSRAADWIAAHRPGAHLLAKLGELVRGRWTCAAVGGALLALASPVYAQQQIAPEVADKLRSMTLEQAVQVTDRLCAQYPNGFEMLYPNVVLRKLQESMGGRAMTVHLGWDQGLGLHRTSIICRSGPVPKEVGAGQSALITSILDASRAGQPTQIMISRDQEAAMRQALGSGVEINLIANAGGKGLYELRCGSSGCDAPGLILAILKAAAEGEKSVQLTISRNHEETLRSMLQPNGKLENIANAGSEGVYRVSLPD